MARNVRVYQESFPIRGVFRISRGSRTTIEPIVVEIGEAGALGRGEAIASPRYETVAVALEQAHSLIPRLAEGLDRQALRQALPAGAARKAIDCALWGLEAKRSGQPVWRLADLPEPGPLTTAFTLSIDTPEAMAAAALDNAHRPLLKLKLAGDAEDLPRVQAVREHAPFSTLIVDANEAWTPEIYQTMVAGLVDCGVAMIEQPFPADADGALADLPRPIPLCADESCHTSADLPRLRGRYDLINIKLDKTGGLTEALALREAARAQGFGIMVGCMLATSLAMAPATLVAQGAEYVDLDGPLLLARDREPRLLITDSEIAPLDPELWG